MTRFLGAALLTAASVLAGLYAGARVKLRCETLGQCTALAAFFASSISQCDESLPDIVHSACESGSFSRLDFLDSVDEADLTGGFARVWSESIEKSAFCLDAESKSLLISFGSRLGKSDTNDQVGLCEFYRQRFELNETAQRHKCSEQVRLYRVAGFAFGGLLLVFLSGG